jgi:hypothetical protein
MRSSKVTAEVSVACDHGPGCEGVSVDVFWTSEVASVIDPSADEKVYTAS